MRSIAYAHPTLPGFAPPKTYAAWPVWHDSIKARIKWQRLPKNLANRIYQKARAYNRTARIEGRYGGALGSAALRVLESLIFDFLNFTTGRLDPSYEKIAGKTGLGRSTVAEALARLKQLGIIHWVRRCAEDWVDGKYQLKQESNAYSLRPPSQWIGFEDPDPPAQPPDPESWGAAPPPPDQITLAADDARHGASLGSVAAVLEADPADQVAQALARFARSMAAAESAKPAVLPESGIRMETCPNLDS